MIQIDGSQGEGGGQIIRSSLALSLLTGIPFAISNVRAGRKEPGLKLQHVTAVQAAAEVGSAQVTGDNIGSQELVFEPGEIRPGDYTFRIDTAGSVTLVLQTILPALFVGNQPSHIRLFGGTHNPFAPPFDFLQKTYLPLVQQLGPEITAKIHAHGFYPAGGGQFDVSITPCETLCSLELLERGKLIRRSVRAIVSALPTSIGNRECERIRSKTNWDPDCFSVEEVEQPKGPGNVVLIELEYENLTEVFIAFGKRGLSAEKVADAVAREARAYEKRNLPVGEHLADQLLLPLAIAAHNETGGGKFKTSALSLHAKTHLDIIAMFLDVDVDCNESNEEVVVTIESALTEK